VSLIGRMGQVTLPELERTFNCGVGMVAVIPAEGADEAIELLVGRGIPAWVAGTVQARTDGGEEAPARLTGDYAGAPLNWAQ